MSADLAETGRLAVSRLPAALPSVRDADLPVVYQRAREALAECIRVDECKDWADKALALSSYARQAQDETLETLAVRIRARAIRRAGELLRTLDGRGGDTRGSKRDGGGRFGRTAAAEAAGLSERQRKQATAVARIPEAEFEAAVESSEPPTLTALAEAGRRELSRPKPPGFREATQAKGQIREFAAFCAESEAGRWVQGIEPFQVPRVREHVAAIAAWLDRLPAALRQEGGDE